MSFAYGQVFNAPLKSFRSTKGETSQLVAKKLLSPAGKWTDDGSSLILRNLTPTQTQFFGKSIGFTGVGGESLESLSQEALESAMKNHLKKSGVNGLRGSLKSMLQSSDLAVRETAQAIVKNLENAGVANDVLDASLTQSLKIGFAPVSKKVVGDSVVGGTGKTLAELTTEASEGTITKNQLKVILNGSETTTGVLPSMAKNSKFSGKTMLYALVPLAIISPTLAGTIVGRVFDAAGTALDLGSDDEIPKCPKVGEVCDSNASLPLGCVCVDDDGDGEGVVEQQGFVLNAEGYLMLGVLGIVGVGVLALIFR